MRLRKLLFVMLWCGYCSLSFECFAYCTSFGDRNIHNTKKLTTSGRVKRTQFFGHALFWLKTKTRDKYVVFQQASLLRSPLIVRINA